MITSDLLEPNAEFFDALSLWGNKTDWLRFEELGDQVAVEVAVVQDAEAERDCWDQNALQAPNIWQNIKNRISISIKSIN